ncbi:MAG: SDR family oxidoreductase [Balneolaceae bacterium]|nr:MAG: SDR family oxidoreductase [Balneolaceae bacterium]
MSNPFSLAGKTIFVTGASSGIGKITAKLCSEQGARLIISGRNEERLNETFSLLTGVGHEIRQMDISEAENITGLIESLPQIDGFVSNAGVAKLSSIRFIKEIDLRNILEVNSIAPILLTKQLMKSKKLKNPSSVVFTSSIAGMYSSTMGNSMYSASKAALNGFMKNAAVELAAKGIRCNTVNPGFVQTSMVDFALLKEEEIDDIRKSYPLKRLGTPEDVAHGIIYLLSDASSWVTGITLVIDGGFTAK